MPTCQPPAPYQRDSATSRAAAHAIGPKAPNLRALVLEFLRGRGPTGATDEEIQQCLMMSANTQRPRRVELARAGRIRKAEHTRTTNAGRAAVVWVAADGV